MWLLWLSVCLAIFSSSFTSASEPHYLITVPTHSEQGKKVKACATFLDLKEVVDFKIELKHDDHVYPVVECKINPPDHSECYDFQVPEAEKDRSLAAFHVSIHGENINVDESKKVFITKTKNVMCEIQNDKSTYKPGETVRFRVVSVDRDLKVISKKYSLVEIKDPNKNRIVQWLDATTKDGFADFSFPLSDELALGDYAIHVADGCSKYFSVEEYVLKRFELKIKTPPVIFTTDKSFHLEACGSYTYGKSVAGLIGLSLCLHSWSHDWHQESHNSSSEENNCLYIKEQADSKGCVSKDIQLESFKFSSTDRHQYLEINGKLIEKDTGHSDKVSFNLYLNSPKKTVTFVDCDRHFYKGFPYHGKVQVTDEKQQPIANEPLRLNMQSIEDANGTDVNLVTDSHGFAQFELDTSEWESFKSIAVHFQTADHDEEDTHYVGHNSGNMLWLISFDPSSESLLTIPKRSKDVPCHSEQSITVEYDIHKKNLDSDTDHLHFFSILLSKEGISLYKEHKLDIQNQGTSPNLRGSFPINFHVVEDFFPAFSVIVFSILPKGKTLLGFTEYNVSPCEQQQVKLSFSKEQVRPGESVNLEVTADAGSICSVRSIDKGYFSDGRTHDAIDIGGVITRIRESVSDFRYTHVSMDPLPQQCPENTSAEMTNIDAYHLFLMKNVLVFTNTGIHAPVKCVSHEFSARSSTRMKKTEHKDTDKELQRRFTRKDFPVVWLYDLVTVGPEGHTVLNRATPHSITKWVTDAFCLGKSGFASVKDVEITTFQPYFMDLIVPHSAVQGEIFTVQALVFSYVKKCIMIGVSLFDAENLITKSDKEQTRCVCEGHAHSFSWDVTALNPKTLNIHVDSGAIELDGDCTKGTEFSGNLRTDSVEKKIVIKPRGYEDHETKAFILYPSDNREALTINIDVPKRLVAGSEHAHIIVQGDIMANVISNVDDIIYLPDGCGEQNIAKFSRYISTLNYLESIKELTPETKVNIIEELVKTYQKQLTFKNENGAYAFFPGGSDNVWITGMTLRVFSAAQKYIHIDENHIQQPIQWLQSIQQPNGCFRNVGTFFNNELEADDDVTSTAQIAIAFLEHHVVHTGSSLENALGCLRKSLHNATSVYSQGLLAYAFTLSGDTELRDQMLKTLEEKAVKKDAMKYWETESYDEGEVETATYVIMALLSGKTITKEDLENCGTIVRWVVKQQNPWGGFRSSQDTDVGLQALAKYAKAINHEKGDAMVTITSKAGFEKIIHVDRSNSLLVQTVDLPEIPGEYTISATGDGFVYVQSQVHCNVFPEKTDKGHFFFNVRTEPSTCTHASEKKFDVHVDVRYLGKRENTNMALIILEPFSGYVPDRESVKKLKEHPLVGRTEVTAQNITIYLTKITHETTSFVFSLEQEAHVENLQPATAVVLDYYDPDEYIVVEYNAPCSSVVAHCAVTAAEREDCGQPNITKDQCEQKGCCYNDSTPGTKWCFFQGYKKAEDH